MLEIKIKLPKLNSKNEIEVNNITLECKDLEELNSSNVTIKTLLKEIEAFKYLKTREKNQGLVEAFILDRSISKNYPWLEDIAKGNFSTEPKITMYDNQLTKIIQRKRINKVVRDDQDSIADLAKWNSVLTSLVSLIYSTLTDTAKDKLTDEERTLIETALDKFSKTTTNADNQFSEKGLNMINDLLNKEASIAEIIKQSKEEI